MRTNKALSVLDIGTSSFKCGSIDEELNVIVNTTQDFDIDHDRMYCEVDFKECFTSAGEILKKILKATVERKYSVEAILITSQAQTFAPVDEHFAPLDNGIAWLDTRAMGEERFLSDKFPDFCKTGGFSRVFSSLYISKLLWLRNNRPDLYRKASYFPLIDEYVAFKLTGKFYSNYTNFGMGGVLDIRRRNLNQKALDILELTERNFPEIGEAAGISYELTQEAACRLGIKERVPVCLCGNDQSASAVGAGLRAEGDVSANFGTAMVLYIITKEPLDAVRDDQIVGLSPLGNNYFLICYESQFGNIVHRLKESLFGKVTTYDEFLSKYNTVRNSGAFINIRAEGRGIIYDESTDRDVIAGSVVKFFLERFLYHLSQIEKVYCPKQIYVSGGVLQSAVWLDIIKQNCKYKIVSFTDRAAGLIGAAKIYRNKALRQSNLKEKKDG